MSEECGGVRPRSSGSAYVFKESIDVSDEKDDEILHFERLYDDREKLSMYYEDLIATFDNEEDDLEQQVAELEQKLLALEEYYESISVEYLNDEYEAQKGLETEIMENELLEEQVKELNSELEASTLQIEKYQSEEFLEEQIEMNSERLQEENSYILKEYVEIHDLVIREAEALEHSRQKMANIDRVQMPRARQMLELIRHSKTLHNE